MQRIFNIAKWSLIPSGKAMKFDGDRPRAINLEVNSPAATCLFLVVDGHTKFLARVEGRDTVQFFVNGSFSVASDGADCYIYTVDGDKFTWEELDETSFTVVRDRPPRNYELELIAHKMAENMNRRLEQQAREIEASVERRARASAAQSEAARVAKRVPKAGAAASDDGSAGGAPSAAGKRGAGSDAGDTPA